MHFVSLTKSWFFFVNFFFPEYKKGNLDFFYLL